MESKDQPEGEIERMTEFLNSRGVGFQAGIDRFSSLEDASHFLVSTFGHNAVVSSRTLKDLKRLRTALLDLVMSGWTKKTAQVELDAIASEIPFTVVFQSASETRLAALDAEDFRASILRDVYALVTAGQWSRFKNCSNEACSATFFDRSRNKTQRWHSFDSCGNKHNVAAYRARLG